MLEGECHQNNLQADLDRLMRDMRSCEDHFLILVTHINVITHPNDAPSPFVNEHIANYRAAIQRAITHMTVTQAQYVGVLGRYCCGEVGEGDDAALMKRVAYRLLEIFFGSISALNNKIPHILHEYLRLKMNCQRLFQESAPNPYQLIKTVTDYEFRKLKKHLDLLTELTDRLQNGDIDCFSEFQLASLLESRPSNREVPIAKSPFYSTFKISKLRREKQTSKPQIPATDKMKPKRVKGIYENIKDVMEVNRQDFLHDFPLCQSGKEALLRQLLNKNKVNQEIIQEFCARKRKIQNKIKNKTLIQISQDPQPAENLPEQSKSFCSTRKNLLLKLRISDKNGKPLPSELFRKTHKVQEVRLRLKSYNRERVVEQKEDTIDNQEKRMELAECENACPPEERLPTLNKRAHSVDQDYKQIEDHHPKTLANSVKINEEHLKPRGKLEKVEMLPAKIKLQLKAFNAVTFETTKKAGKVGELSKYLYF